MGKVVPFVKKSLGFASVYFLPVEILPNQAAGPPQEAQTLHLI